MKKDFLFKCANPNCGKEQQLRDNVANRKKKYCDMKCSLEMTAIHKNGNSYIPPKGSVPWNKGLTKDTDERLNLASYTQSKSRLDGLNKGRIKTWCDGLTKDDHPSLKRLSESRKGKKNPVHKKGVKEKIRKTLLQTYKDHPEILENRKPAGINQFSNNLTSIEEPIANLLEKFGIPYEHNVRVGRFFPDFIINNNIIIECDGEYWHQDTEKEERRDKYLLERGFQVFHLMGKEIMQNAELALMSVLDQL